MFKSSENFIQKPAHMDLEQHQDEWIISVLLFTHLDLFNVSTARYITIYKCIKKRCSEEHRKKEENKKVLGSHKPISSFLCYP